MMFYVLLLPRVFLTPPVASAIPILDDKPSSYRSKCCTCSGPLWVVCHERSRSKRRRATVREMKEGPSGSAIRC